MKQLVAVLFEVDDPKHPITPTRAYLDVVGIFSWLSIPDHIKIISVKMAEKP